MKLASLRDGSRDGAFVVVSDDLKTAIAADTVAPSLLAAVEDWEAAEPTLQALAKEGQPYPLADRTFESPLPRSYQFLDGSVYLYHAELLRQAQAFCQ